MSLHIGLLVFPNVQQLDLTGPYEVFACWPDVRLSLVWKSPGAVNSTSGLPFEPSHTFDTCPQLDVVVVPGGKGINALLLDDVVLDFLRRQARGATYVTSVCTGALVLGAAGLLKGKRATTHWTVLDLLAAFGAIPTSARVVRDGAIVTGGGITAGVDFALSLVGDIAGQTVAEAIQLQLEYAPAPPFDAGSPLTARPDVVAAVQSQGALLRTERKRLVEAAALKLGI